MMLTCAALMRPIKVTQAKNSLKVDSRLMLCHAGTDMWNLNTKNTRCRICAAVFWIQLIFDRNFHSNHILIYC